jgi:hypothetical protein
MLGEETLGALHIIVAVLLFHEGWNILAWIFVARAVVDKLGAMRFAYKARRLEPDGPTDAFHLSCPGCGQEIDLIPGSARGSAQA